VGFCSQWMVDPTRVKNTFVLLLGCSRDLGTVGADVEKTHQVLGKIEKCATATQLVEVTMAFFIENINFTKTATEAIHPEIAKALVYINKQYMGKITLDDVAKEVGLSKEYVSRLFLKEVGVNLFHYIGEVRMRKAAEILTSNPAALIKEVASAVGFDNPYFFSTKFKEYYGVSPNNFKAQPDTPTGKKES